MIMIILKCLAAWGALLVIGAPVLIPLLARRFRKHDEWVHRASERAAASNGHPTVRMLRR